MWRRARIWALLLLLAAALILPAARAASAGCESLKILGFWDGIPTVMLGDELDVVSPGSNQLEVVRRGAARMPELMCHAVSYVAYVTEEGDEEGTMGWTNGLRPDLVHLVATDNKLAEENLDPARSRIAANVRAAAVQSLLHESAHAADFLLQVNDDVEDDPGIAGQVVDFVFGDNEWTEAAHAAARGAIASNRLMGGLRQEWEQVHRSFVDAGLAAAYHGSGDVGWDGASAVRSGVMSGYGGHGAGEDIAEMAAGVLAAPVHEAEGASSTPPDPACRAMRQQSGPGVPDELAAVFTKVGFLQSVGLVGEEDYRRCVGDLRIRGEGSGFFTFEAGQRVNEYTGQPQGTIGKIDGSGPWMFQIEARGRVRLEDEGYRPARAVLMLAIAPGDRPLQRVSFPRGLYRIGQGGGNRNTFKVFYEDDGEDKLGIEVFQGDVLVARASHDLVEGSIFIQKIINWTELFPLPIPPDEERIVTFRKE